MSVVRSKIQPRHLLVHVASLEKSLDASHLFHHLHRAQMM